MTNKNLDKKKYIADIIIPHHDRDDLLQKCLECIDRDIFNIIISSGGTFAENCNEGAKKVVTETIIFVNDDTEPSSFLLKKMCELNCDIVGIAQNVPSSQDVVFGLGLQLTQKGSKRNFAKNISDFAIPSGFLFKISRNAWNQLDGFDENFINGCEDVDLFLRAIEKKMSFGLVQDPIIHRHSQSQGRNDHDDENSIFLNNKWNSRRIRQLVRLNKDRLFIKRRNLYWKFDKIILSSDKNILSQIDKFPLISVIIPSRVGEKILTLKSLNEQTYPNIEIIIEYDKNKSGASATRNRGAKKASGEYLFFCDNDLILYSDCILNLFTTFIKYPKADWVFGKFYIDQILLNDKKTPFIPQNKFSIEWLYYFEGISTMSLIKADIFPQFDESMLRYNDWDLWLTLDRKGYRAVFCDSVLFSTKIHENGISKPDKNDMMFWLDRLYQKYNIEVARYIYDLEQQNREIQSSKSLAIGKLFFRSVKRPYKLFTLPINLINILFK